MICTCEVLHLYLRLVSMLSSLDEKRIRTTWYMPFQMLLSTEPFTAIGTKYHVYDGVISEIQEGDGWE